MGRRNRKKNTNVSPDTTSSVPQVEKATGSGAELAAAYKAKGAAAYKARNMNEAYVQFCLATDASPSDPALWANRSATASAAGNYKAAVADAKTVIRLKPTWNKGYVRLADAYLRQKNYTEARRAYATGLVQDPDSQVFVDGLAKVFSAEAKALGKPNPFVKSDVKLDLKGGKQDAPKAEKGIANGETVIGIDLGTTFSCVGVWEKDGVKIIPNSEGALTTPSWVAFSEEGRLVGQPAKSQAARNPTNTLFNIKRIIGREYSECSSDVKRMPFKVLKGAGDKPVVEVDLSGGVEGKTKMQTFLPEQISAMVLTKMKETAEAHLGYKVTKAVVTVPAYFNDMQRRLTKDAGAIAGLEVLRIINEPTAAALSYGLHEKKDGNVLVFDLGGGTFDVSLLKIEEGIFKVLATAGDTHLGGEDFDIALAEWVERELEKKNGKNIFTDDEGAKRKLRTACEKAKRELSNQESTTLEVFVKGEEIVMPITRKRFEQLNEKTFQRCLDSVKHVLRDAGCPAEKVSDIVLVGGSTRVPRVREILREHFKGKQLCCNINPDEAVAYGATVQGAILGGVKDDDLKSVLLVDVIPISLGVGCEGNQFAVVVPRNSTVPCKKTKEFTTCENGQTSIDVPIFEGERKNCDGNHKLGEFTISGIQKAKKGEAKVDMTFEIDSNGLLTVTAQDQVTGATANVSIQHDKGRLSPSDIKRLQKEAEQFAVEDELRAREWELKQAAHFA